MVNLEDVSDAIVSVCVAVSCLHMGMYTAQRWRAQVGVGCFVGGRGRTLPEDGSALVWPFYAVLMPCLAIPCHPCLCPCAFHSMHSTLPSTCINLPVSSVVGSGHRWRPTPVVVVHALTRVGCKCTAGWSGFNSPAFWRRRCPPRTMWVVAGP